MHSNQLNPDIKKMLQQGIVIPAHPLALQPGLTIDETSQRMLTRYYIASGAGGIAVGVHTTQFEIRKAEFNLLEPVLRIASEEIEQSPKRNGFVKVAGICGPTENAVQEAKLAVKYGYHLGLLSMGGLQDYSEEELIKRTQSVAEIIPVFGFYLQPSAGGRILSYEFWRAFVDIPNVHAIKVAAFNRYQTLDVVRAVCFSSRRDEIVLYTGNDDNIIPDLLTPYHFTVNGQAIKKSFAGGLLGHWSVWTKKAVDLLEEIKKCINSDYAGVEKLLLKGIEVTDMNAAIFDPQHFFKGCISGIHEILYRQGLMQHRLCLDPKEKLSAGQQEEINRVIIAYPYLTDDEFVTDFVAGERKSMAIQSEDNN